MKCDGFMKCCVSPWIAFILYCRLWDSVCVIVFIEAVSKCICPVYYQSVSSSDKQIRSQHILTSWWIKGLFWLRCRVGDWWSRGFVVCVCVFMCWYSELLGWFNKAVLSLVKERNITVAFFCSVQQICVQLYFFWWHFVSWFCFYFY